MSKNINRHQSDFRQIMKGTAIFGGTQIVVMLSNVVRGKLIAMILGAYGMGVSSLLTSAIQPVVQFFSLGLPQSAVSSIANAVNDDERIQKTIAFRRCLLVLAAIGCLFMVMSSSILARLTSGVDSDFISQRAGISTWFMALGLAVFFMILAAGENAVLQSHRALTALAKCNTLAPILGLAIGVPLYYSMGTRGIVPAMIVLPMLTWAYTRWSTRQLGISAQQTWRETFSIGRSMMLLGMTMMVAGLLGNLAMYIINMFINKTGTTADVGMFQAANTITTQCTMMVFTALATDYYPHLSQMSGKLYDMQRFINQEGETVILLTAPIAALIILLAPVMVTVLLTKEFMDIVPLIQMMSLAFLMRAYYFPLDYICLARNDKSYFFWMEGIWTNVKMIVCFCVGYALGGLTGLGYAAVVNAIIDIVVSTIMVRWRYGMVYQSQMFFLTALMLLLCAGTLAAYQMLSDTYLGILVPALLTVVICIISLRQLNKRMNIMEYIRRRLHHE